MSEKDRQFLESQQKTEAILNPQFAEQVNKIAGSLSDDVNLRTLAFYGIPSNFRLRQAKRDPAPASWQNFINSLELEHRKNIHRILNSFIRSLPRETEPTLGDLREAVNKEEFRNTYGFQGARLPFARLAFRKVESDIDQTD